MSPTSVRVRSTDARGRRAGVESSGGRRTCATLFDAASFTAFCAASP
jgi:hypothetical protein